MQHTFETPRQVRLVVDNEVGLVEITAADTVLTAISLEADSPGAQEKIERAIVECKAAGGRDLVVVRIPHRHGMKFTRGGGVSVRVELPLGSDISVTTASADVDLNGLVGEADIKSASGHIVADNAAGDFRAKSASGDISVGMVGGELRAHSTSGEIRVVGVEGRAAVSTTSGAIEVGSADDRVDVRSTSGDVHLGDLAGDATVVDVSGEVRVLSFSSGRMHVRSVSGDISVGIPQGVTLSVDAESLSGSVRSDIPLSHDQSSSNGPPAVILTARNVSGDVLVERAATISV
jgi:DUF4097 and DUF4098 domain-containing protein YvlB